MPWEKNFDLDEATDKAISVFWKKGYEATSMSDLIDGMGINKGSLYNAFGSKKALFDRALLRYDQKNRLRALAQLSQMPDGREAIVTLFDGLVAETQEDTENRGCMLVNTALELPLHGEDIREMVTSALGEFEEFFRQSIIKGQSLGTIPKALDPSLTAKSLLTSVIGMRVLARGTFDVDGIRAIRDAAVVMITNPEVS
ncbi:MAG: TetR/AcrR family transcriptional regulator [Stappiaceae bacterium]